MYKQLNQLREEGVVLLTADIWLDNGIDDLSLGQIEDAMPKDGGSSIESFK